MTTKVLTQQEIQICTNWVKYFASKEGYTDCDHNADLIHNYIDNACGGVYSYNNLTAGMEHYRSNLVGLGLAATRERQEEIAKRQAAEELQKRIDADIRTAAAYVKQHCPTGLIVNGDFYSTTSDKILTFIRAKYKEAPLTFDQLHDAISTLWNSLDWFDKSPESLVFRNIPKPVRVLSKQARIDAGMEIEIDKRNHANDGKLVNPNDAIRSVLKKIAGKAESPDEIFCAQISVNTRYGKLDHGATAAIRNEFVYDRKGAIDWKLTKEKRVALASAYERDRNKVGRYERG